MKWVEAARPLDLARQALPETAEFVALDLARVKRMSEGEKAVLSDIAKDSAQLRDFLQLESGSGVSGPFLAFHSLAIGRLDEALKHAAGSPEMVSDISLLVAASEGSSSQLAFLQLAQPVAEDTTLLRAWYLLALAASYGRDTTTYAAAVIKRSPEVKEWITEFDRMVRGNPALFEAHVGRLPVRGKGYAYAAAVIVLGNRAPAAWRESAKRLLFIVERPYFRQ